MNKQIYILFDLLIPTLGEYKKKGNEIRFNCPICDEGGKFNLECNIEKKIFSCWACRFGGTIRKLFKNYCNIDSWKNFDYFKINTQQTLITNEFLEKKVTLPENTLSYFRNDKAKEFLINKRKLSPEILKQRSVKYVYDGYCSNSIFYPFYENGNMFSGCVYNLLTEKYKNLSPLNFVPYKEFIDENYPITLTEGVVDCLSAINSIPCLGTKINGAILEFLYNKNVILAFDNKVNLKHYSEILNHLEKANIKQLAIFDLHEFEDINDFYVRDYDRYIKEYEKNIKILLNG